MATSTSSAKVLRRDTWVPARFVAPGSSEKREDVVLGVSVGGEEIAMTEFVARNHVGQTKAEALQVKRRYTINDPLGKTIEIPDAAADDFAYFAAGDAEGLRSYYEREGYVVVRGLIGPDECDHAHAIFEREVKPTDSFIYRQATANPERLSTPDMAIC